MDFLIFDSLLIRILIVKNYDCEPFMLYNIKQLFDTVSLKYLLIKINSNND